MAKQAEVNRLQEQLDAVREVASRLRARFYNYSEKPRQHHSERDKYLAEGYGKAYLLLVEALPDLPPLFDNPDPPR